MKKYLSETTKIPLNRAMKYYHSMSFVGRGPFPIDMLRYDECWPKKEGTISNGEEELHLKFNDYDSFRIVVVVKYSSHKEESRSWTFDRWRSFSWVPVPAVIDCYICDKNVNVDYAEFDGTGKTPRWHHHLCVKK